MKTHGPLTWLTCLALLSPFSSSAAEQTAVVKDSHVNVRGQPSLSGEVITQLQQGEKVVVLEEIASAKAKTNEPPKWARIQMPPNTPVWVYAAFIDSANKSVKVPRLNLRAGPGENFSVVGRLERGAPITEIRRVEDWIEIETPPGAYGFVAADLLTSGAGSPAVPPSTAKHAPTPPTTTLPPVTSAPPATTVPPQPEPGKSTTVEAAKPPAVVQPKSESPVPPQQMASNPKPLTSMPPAPTGEPIKPGAALQQKPLNQAKLETLPPSAPVHPAPAHSVPAQPAPAQPAQNSGPLLTLLPGPRAETAPGVVVRPKAEEGPQKRIVRREGLVRSTASIQAPTYYELLSPENRKTINYLHTDTLNLNLKDYRGRRIIVVGEEAIDPRWPKTPVIEVEKLELIP